MSKVIIFRQKGDWKKTRKFLKRCSDLDLDDVLNLYGQEGVDALAKATPKDTGKTAASWSYEVTKGRESIVITWKNSNIVDGRAHCGDPAIWPRNTKRRVCRGCGLH